MRNPVGGVREDNKHGPTERHFAAAVTKLGLLGSKMYENIRVRMVAYVLSVLWRITGKEGFAWRDQRPEGELGAIERSRGGFVC